MKKNDNDEIVFLSNYLENITDAAIAKQVLEENGIPCMIYNETLSSIEWGAWALPQIMVFKRDVERAKQALSYMEEPANEGIDNYPYYL